MQGRPKIGSPPHHRNPQEIDTGSRIKYALSAMVVCGRTPEIHIPIYLVSFCGTPSLHTYRLQCSAPRET